MSHRHMFRRPLNDHRYTGARTHTQRTWDFRWEWRGNVVHIHDAIFYLLLRDVRLARPVNTDRHPAWGTKANGNSFDCMNDNNISLEISCQASRVDLKSNHKRCTVNDWTFTDTILYW